MCPLRIILIFLSATLAGFFVLKNLKSPPINSENDDDVNSPADKEIESPNSLSLSSKLCGAMRKGFWTFVDMASGSYLWRNLVSSSAVSSTANRAD